MCQYQGISLIEILVSLFLLSLMLLGLDAAEVAALRETKSAYYFSTAKQQLDNLLEIIMAFKSRDCSQHIIKWNNENHFLLPNGNGEVRGQYPHITVAIAWGKNLVNACQKNEIGSSGCLVTALNL